MAEAVNDSMSLLEMLEGKDAEFYGIRQPKVERSPGIA